MATDVLTLRQVAAEVGLTRQAVALAIRDGRLTASVVVGKHRRCTRAEVDAWLARRQQGAQGRPGRSATGQRTAAHLDTLFDFIVEHKRAHGGRCPTRQQMADALGISSHSEVARRLAYLAADGRIVLEGDGEARNISIPGERWLAPGEAFGEECDGIEAASAATGL